MKTITDWQKSMAQNGLIETMWLFHDHVCKKTHRIVSPGYSFAHIVIDDYNLGDDNIDFCLSDDAVNDYLIGKLKDIDYQDGDCEKDTWESFDYWSLVEGSILVISFLNWLKTIPESERDVHWNRYHGLPDNATEEDYRRYFSRIT